MSLAVASATRSVTTSYAVLRSVSEWIAAHKAKLGKNGVVPQYWGPDASTDSVRIALQNPVSTQERALFAVLMRHHMPQFAKEAAIAPPGSIAADRIFQRAAAALVAMDSHHLARITTFAGLIKFSAPSSGYMADTKPFFGADEIYYELTNIQYCTSNFPTENSSGDTYTYTAAHCSNYNTGHDFYTCATINSDNDCVYQVGGVSTVYDTNDNDFEIIPTTDGPFVWNDNGSSSWEVTGSIDAVSGEI
jgi:hypothetical protein